MKKPNPKEYEVIIDWSCEDKCYVVKAPDLPGCTCDGKTRVEATRNAEKAIDLYLDCLIEDKRPIPKPKSKLALV